MARSHTLADMMRPANTRTSLLLFTGAGILVGVRPAQIVLGSVLIVVLYGMATIGNDLRDIDVDRANNRRTPLTTGRVTSRQAWAALGCCGAAAAVSQPWLVQPAGALFTLAYVTLAAAYSAPRLALEDRGLLATVALAMCYAVLPLGLAIRMGGRSEASVAGVLLAAGLLSSAGVLYKDFKDEVGDRLLGKKTPLVRYGARAVVRLSVALATVGGATLVTTSQHRLLTAALLVGAGCAFARLTSRPGRSPGGLQLYYLLAVAALLTSL